MNKNHKLVWNKARGTYVVAGENARRSVKAKAIACATVMAASVLAAGSAAAAEEPKTLIGVQIDASSFTNDTAYSLSPEVGTEKAVGVLVTETVEQPSSNSGDLSVVVENTPAKAVGIEFTDDIEASVVNSGTIRTEAYDSKKATAIGVRAAKIDEDGALINSGVIGAHVEAAESGDSHRAASAAYGLRIGELDGRVINTGVIRATGSISVNGMATGDQRLYAIYAKEGDGSVTNEAGGVIDGRVVLGKDHKGDHRRRHHHDGIDLTNHGLLDIRSSDSFVSGDFTQSVGGMLKIERLDDSELQHGKLKVAGTASLERGTQLRIKGPQSSEYVAYGRLDGVVRAKKFESLDPASLRITDNILAANFTPELNSESHKRASLDLVAYDTGITTIVDAIRQHRLTSAEQLAGVLDQLIIDPDGRGELTEFLYQLGSSATPEELANKVAQALPLVNGANARASLAAIGSANRIVQSRIEGVSGRSSGDDAFADRHLWLKPFGTWARQDDSAGAPGYDADTAGIVVGFDGLVSTNNRLGVAFSYSNTDVDANTDPLRQRTDISSYQLSVYGSYSVSDSTDVNYLVGVGRHDNDGLRTVSGAEIKSSYDSNSFFAGLGVAHTYAVNELTTVTPSVRLDYARLRADAFTEEGGLVGYAYDSQRAEELVFGIDGKLTRAINDKATFVANIGVGYDLINDRDSATAAFVGAPDLVFTARAGDTDPWIVRGGLGVVGRVNDTVEVTARYDIEGRDDYTNQTASLKLRKSF